MGDNAALVRGNALAIPLRDDSVDLIVTSPPYFALRSYQDGGEHYSGQIGSEATPRAFLEALWAVMDECWRVLKPSGSVFVNLGDKYAGSGGNNNAAIGGSDRGPSRYNQSTDVRAKSKMLLPHRFALGCIDPDYRTCGGPQWVLRADVVWSKPNGLPESVTDRVRASHEYLFHLTKSERYYAGIDEIREQHTDREAVAALNGHQGRLERGPSGMNRSTNVGTDMASGRAFGALNPNPLGKLPGSVWTIPTEPLTVPDWIGVDHYAAFPTELPRRIILGWTPSGICTACGEPRTAVVDKTKDVYYGEGQNRSGAQQVKDGADTVGWKHDEKWRTTATITGYRCACPDTQAATRPAIVLDPFAGTGTTPMVARALGRYGIGLDLSADYLRLARWRVFDSGHWDKAIERTTGRPSCTPDQLPGQMRLL